MRLDVSHLYSIGAVGLYVLYTRVYSIAESRQLTEREPPFRCTVARGMWHASVPKREVAVGSSTVRDSLAFTVTSLSLT